MSQTRCIICREPARNEENICPDCTHACHMHYETTKQFACSIGRREMPLPEVPSKDEFCARRAAAIDLRERQRVDEIWIGIANCMAAARPECVNFGYTAEADYNKALSVCVDRLTRLGYRAAHEPETASIRWTALDERKTG